MNRAVRVVGCLICCWSLVANSGASAQDWPQWRGPNRDAKASGFQPPSQWPEQLTEVWQVTVGDGVATPALVGDRIFVFARQDGHEILRCLELETGEEIWQDKYAAPGASGPASGFAGPRSSPAVVAGKVVTLGANGTLSCLDAASGQLVWRKTGTGDVPRFYTSSSPLVAGGLCIVQIGSENSGAIVAYDLASGEEKWNWAGDGTAYASPVLFGSGQAEIVVAETARNVIGLSLADGELLWQIPFAVEGRGYNASTPLVDEQVVIFAGSNRGTRAVRIEKRGDQWAVEQLWANENSVQYNTPVQVDGLIFGITDRDSLFCINAETGQTAWVAPLEGRGRLRGYGSVVDGGSVLAALNPTAQLIFFKPSAEEFQQVARYKVSESETFAYPVLTGNRVLIKDENSLILWAIE